VTSKSIDLAAAQAILETAFEGVQFPGDENLLRADCQDDSEIRDFVGKGWHSWQEIPRATINHNYCSLPFFSPSALIFLLPAYMSAGLDDLSSNEATFTVYRLRPSEDRDYFLKWTALLTSAQKKSIALFLQCAIEYGLDGATAALDSYWREAI
jgi:hypothetical protein